MGRVRTTGNSPSGSESEALYRQIVEHTHDGVWVTDADAVTTFVNQQAAELLGHPIDDIVGRSMFEFIHEADHKSIQSGDDGADGASGPVSLRRRDGAEVWVVVSATALQDQTGKFVGLLNTLADVTEFHAAEQALEQRKNWLSIVVNSAPLVLWAVDMDGTVTLSEGRGLVNLGFESGELVGRNVFELYPDDPESHKAIRRAMAGERFILTSQREDLWFETSFTPIIDESGEPAGVIAVSHDVTERKRAQEKVDYLAYHDELTGLPNRSLFQDHMALALARARRRKQAVALLYLDLDRFKLVNDSFGHSAGDELLRRLASRLRALVRDEDLVARHSGDEFLVLLADLPMQVSNGETPERFTAVGAAELVGEKIHESLREVVEIGGHEISIDASIGISLYPRDAADGEALLQHADIAMYESKRFGRGRTEVFGRTSHQPSTQLSIAGQLRGALERDEFTLHYQPIVELRSGTVRGVEALLRWSRSNGEISYPKEFIPVVEEIGMLKAVDDWVVCEASRQWRAWHDAGLDLQVSINVSSLQFRSPDLAEALLDQICAGGADPGSFIVEITESALMADTDVAKDILKRLQAASLYLAIDDFGSGYSSLSRLADLPVHMLKMDGAFVHNVPKDEAASVMVSGIVQIAERMGVYSLAEKIESPAQRDFLVSCGCDLGQGFLFSKAVPAEQVPDLV